MTMCSWIRADCFFCRPSMLHQHRHLKLMNRTSRLRRKKKCCLFRMCPWLRKMWILNVDRLVGLDELLWQEKVSQNLTEICGLESAKAYIHQLWQLCRQNLRHHRWVFAKTNKFQTFWTVVEYDRLVFEHGPFILSSLEYEMSLIFWAAFLD